MRLIGVEWQVTDLVNDQESVAAETLHQVRQAILTHGSLDLQHQVGGCCEPGLDPGIRGLVTKSNGQVCLADAGWAEEDDVLAACDEAQGAQLLDLAPWGCGGELEVVIAPGLDRRKTGHPDEGCGGSGSPPVPFGDERVLQKVGKALLGIGSLRGKRGIAFGNAGQLQFFAEGVDTVWPDAHAALAIAQMIDRSYWAIRKPARSATGGWPSWNHRGARGRASCAARRPRAHLANASHCD